MKIKAEKDSSVHPSVQNDFLLYASKFIVQSHFTMRELPITIPIHIYYCFMTWLKLWALFYLIIVCRKGIYPTMQARKKLLGSGGQLLLLSYCKLLPDLLPAITPAFFSTSVLYKHLSPAEFCIIISADVTDSICQVESHFVISSPYF